MAPDVRTKAETFARKYAAPFSSPHCSSPEHVANIAQEVSQHYRPGVTFFTNGKITRLQTQEAAALIEKEMRKNIRYGIGTCLKLDGIPKIEIYSPTSALCWLNWTFHPAVGSEYDGRTWSFTNIYGYRDATAGSSNAGLEFVVRDEEVNEMLRVTGKSFNN